MTPQQLQTLRAAILADPAVSPVFAEGSLSGVADYYNTLASPDFIVLRTSITRHEIMAEPSPEGTLFIWAGNGYITRVAGEREAFRDMFNSTGTVNPSRPNVQQGIQDVFSGAGNAALNRAHIAAIAKRKATRFEKLFATGTGSVASPAAVVVEGLLDWQQLIGL